MSQTSRSRKAHLLDDFRPASGAHAPSARRPRSKLAREPAGRPGAAPGGGFERDGAAYRAACRLFPGFAELPSAFRATLDGYAPLFVAATGPLTLHERELLARAVTGREQPGFGSTAGAGQSADDTAAAAADVLGGDDAAASSQGVREHLIAAFAVKVTRRWLAIGGADVERLLDAGLSAHAVRAIAEIAAVFHFIAEVSAAMLLRPRIPRVGRTPISAVSSKDPTWRELSRWLG
jgi:hypothetical protein